MIARYKPQASETQPKAKAASRKAKRRLEGGNYFPDESEPKQYIPTGCTLLDCVLGGGWVIGRVGNIVGDKSTGKTLLAIEACANFSKKYAKGRIYYREAESAFDTSYAERLGLPLDRVDFGSNGPDTPWRTIEEVFRDLREKASWHLKHKVPGLYIVDSLDALTSEQALKRDVGEGSYRLEKQKILSQLFEELISDFKASRLCILIVSQVRERIGFVVGDKYRRSGGMSLDFYASHILWLTHLKTISPTIRGEKRAVGIRIRASCKKNKVDSPFRVCTFPILFKYGIDDAEASMEWLIEKKMYDRLGLTSKDAAYAYLDELETLDPQEYMLRITKMREVVVSGWREVEGWFEPKRRKYA